MSVLKQQARGSSARLRALSRLGTALLAFLVLIACVALVVLTTLSRRYERRVAAVNDSLRAIEELRVDFGNYLRQGSLARITHDPTYAANRMRLEADILEDSSTAVRLATGAALDASGAALEGAAPLGRVHPPGRAMKSF